MLYLQSWHCRLLLIRNVKGEQQRIQQCSLNFCCLERMLHLLPSSSNFCFISLEQNTTEQKYRQNCNGKSPLCLSPLSTSLCYTLQVTFAGVKSMSEMHILHPELGSKKSYIPWSHPWLIHLNSESWARATNLPSLSFSETTLRRTRLLLQVLQLCEAIASFENSGLLSEQATNQNSGLWKSEGLVHSNKKILLTNSSENKSAKFALFWAIGSYYP